MHFAHLANTLLKDEESARDCHVLACNCGIFGQSQQILCFWNTTIFYRAMLCIRGTSHGPVSVRLSVCPSQVGVLLKRLNVGSHKQQHTIAQGL